MFSAQWPPQIVGGIVLKIGLNVLAWKVGRYSCRTRSALQYTLTQLNCTPEQNNSSLCINNCFSVFALPLRRSPIPNYVNCDLKTFQSIYMVFYRKLDKLKCRGTMGIHWLRSVPTIADTKLSTRVDRPSHVCISTSDVLSTLLQLSSPNYVQTLLYRKK